MVGNTTFLHVHLSMKIMLQPSIQNNVMLIVSFDNSVISKNIVNTTFIIVEPINFKLGHLVNQIK
jgi:hypothetical protein